MNKLKWLGPIGLVVLLAGGCMTNAKHLKLQKEAQQSQKKTDAIACEMNINFAARDVEEWCNDFVQDLQLRDAYMLCSIKRADAKQAPNLTWEKGLKEFCDKVFAQLEPKKQAAKPKKEEIEIYLPPHTYDNNKK